MFKWIIGGAMLGAGLVASDWVYTNLIEPKLPADWRYSTNPSGGFGKEDVLYYTLMGAGAIVVVAAGAGVLKLGDKSPIKPAASPV